MLIDRPTMHVLTRLKLAVGVLLLGLAMSIATGQAAMAQGQAGATPPKHVTTSGGPIWSSLSPSQQQVLAPLQQEWAGIDASRKAKWLDVAARFPSMPADERARVQERMAEWARLTPAQRAQARIQFQQARQLPQDELQSRWQSYQALPADAKAALAQRALPSSQFAATAHAASASAPESKASGVLGTSRKRNIVSPTVSSTGKPVSPTVVHAKRGATTTLLTQQPAPPVHQQAGLPKIVATEGFVQPNTLLPRRGPQGAAVRAAPASAPETAQ